MKSFGWAQNGIQPITLTLVLDEYFSISIRTVKHCSACLVLVLDTLQPVLFSILAKELNVLSCCLTYYIKGEQN